MSRLVTTPDAYVDLARAYQRIETLERMVRTISTSRDSGLMTIGGSATAVATHVLGVVPKSVQVTPFLAAGGINNPLTVTAYSSTTITVSNASATAMSFFWAVFL